MSRAARVLVLLPVALLTASVAAEETPVVPPALRKTIDEWLAKIDAWEKGGK